MILQLIVGSCVTGVNIVIHASVFGWSTAVIFEVLREALSQHEAFASPRGLRVELKQTATSWGTNGCGWQFRYGLCEVGANCTMVRLSG